MMPIYSMDTKRAHHGHGGDMDIAKESGYDTTQFIANFDVPGIIGCNCLIDGLTMCKTKKGT